MSSRNDSADPAYLRLLIVLLGTATFFEGYDSAINAVVLKDLAAHFGIDPTNTSALTGPVAAIGMGAFGALFVTTLGDRIGRRPLLIGTTLAYATFTGLTAAAPNLPLFVACQFLARTFLIAEYATAITIVTEEFPADRRGRALGTLTALGAFGLPVAAVTYLLVRNTWIGWRALYLVGVIPLVVMSVLRLKLRETHRWLEAREAKDRGPRRGILAETAGTQHRGTLITVSALFFLTHFALLGATTWWPLYAGNERGFDAGTVAILLATAYPLGVIGYFVAGHLQDRIGRRRAGTIFLIAGLIAGIATFQAETPLAMFPVMTFAVFFGAGVNPIINAVASELFPTSIRATAVAFARSIFGTTGAILGPLAVGILADPDIAARLGLPLLGSLSGAVSIVILVYVPAMLVLRRLPETAGLELETITGT